jgi:SPX domain protein involved in polyphosphate accumulation
MSNLSHTIRRFNRFELKYLVPLKQAEAFRRALGANLLPDDHGDTCGRYGVSSLYYDGPDLHFYWEKVDGIKFRRKLRIRHYGSVASLTADVPVFVEIKQRLNRVTQKRRVRLPYGEALRLCNEREIPEHTLEDAAVIQEITAMLWQYNLHPVSVVSYTRQALVGTDYDVGLRITFDTDLRYRASQLDLCGEGNDLLLFPPDWAVVEIKVNERIPYWLTELVAVHNLNLVRVSKYCRSIELAQDLVTPDWRFVLA